MIRSLFKLAVIAALLTLRVPALRAVTIDFESLPDGTFVSTQFSGLTFSNSAVLTAGISLNELDFPPHSGNNVATDVGGAISINTTSAILDFGAFFTYASPLTIQGFDASNNLLASATSLFLSNIDCGSGPPCPGDPGSSPNEFIQVVNSSGFSKIVITGDPGGASFTMDDVSYSVAGNSSTPEPSSGVLLLTALIGLLITRRVTNWRGEAKAVRRCSGGGC